MLFHHPRVVSFPLLPTPSHCLCDDSPQVALLCLFPPTPLLCLSFYCLISPIYLLCDYVLFPILQTKVHIAPPRFAPASPRHAPPALRHRAPLCPALPHPSPQKHQEQPDWGKWAELRQCDPPLPPTSPGSSRDVIAWRLLTRFGASSWDRVEDGTREERSRHTVGDASFAGGCFGQFGVELYFDTAM